MTTTTTNAQRIAAQALKLRDVSKKHAARVPLFAGIIQLATKGLKAIEAQMLTEAIVIAGDLYDLIMSQSVKPAMQGKTIDTVTFVWMQGESDGIELHGEPPGRGKIYAANLRGLIAQLAGDLKRPDLNVVIGRISSKFSE